MGESNERASWNKVGLRSPQSMEGCRRKPRDTVHREVLGPKAEAKDPNARRIQVENIETRERQKQKKGSKEGKG